MASSTRSGAAGTLRGQIKEMSTNDRHRKRRSLRLARCSAGRM